MKTAPEEVRDWLHTQQDWVQEAAERLLKHGELVDQDIAEISESLKTEQGRTVTSHRSFSSLLASQDSTTELRLKSIGNIQGIENLAPRKPLAFGESNLFVVYGHNGSGKSGYTRILKRLTGKPRAAFLKPNVFRPISGLQTCEIEFNVGEQLHKLVCDVNQAPLDCLKAIEIFDSDEAGHYLTKENVASYTPQLVKIFDQLVEACDRIKVRLEREVSLLVKKLPISPLQFSLTLPIQSYNTLSHLTTDEAIEKLTTWTSVEQALLDVTVERLSVVDPAASARVKRTTKNQADQLLAKLTLANDAYSEANINRIRSFREAANDKRKIAIEAAKVELAELNGVGTATWRAMWEAARVYSQLPYPSQTFPVTLDSRCLFCHQELSEPAQQRLLSFETFVQSQLEAEAKASEAAYQTSLSSLVAPLDHAQIVTYCEAAGITSQEWRDFLQRFWEEVSLARSAMLDHELVDHAFKVVDASVYINALKEYCSDLEATAVQLDQDAISFNRPQQEKNKLNLDALKWTVQNGAAIKDEVVRLKKYKDYLDWINLVNPQRISIKAGKVAEAVITEAYVKRFNYELKLLGAGQLKVDLIKARTERGRALHKLILKGVAGPQQPILDTILSEGERRIISLAAFIADVTGKANISPFVFDDPISSLDQVWEEATIARLVQLSEHRQVIVFTHRLNMLGSLVEQASLAELGVETIHIRQEAWGAGEAGEVPLYGKKPDGALRSIRQARIAQARKVLSEEGNEVYYPHAKAICSDIRIITERLVETVLLADVLQRHRRQINTQGKIHQLAKIKTSDCDLIEEIMGKYSRYEHSQSMEAPVQLPAPEELEADVDRLLNWHTEFKGRLIS